jgi:hypothetical protein
MRFAAAYGSVSIQSTDEPMLAYQCRARLDPVGHFHPLSQGSLGFLYKEAWGRRPCAEENSIWTTSVVGSTHSF